MRTSLRPVGAGMVVVALIAGSCVVGGQELTRHPRLPALLSWLSDPLAQVVEVGKRYGADDSALLVASHDPHLFVPDALSALVRLDDALASAPSCRASGSFLRTMHDAAARTRLPAGVELPSASPMSASAAIALGKLAIAEPTLRATLLSLNGADALFSCQLVQPNDSAAIEDDLALGQFQPLTLSWAGMRGAVRGLGQDLSRAGLFMLLLVVPAMWFIARSEERLMPRSRLLVSASLFAGVTLGCVVLLGSIFRDPAPADLLLGPRARHAMASVDEVDATHRTALVDTRVDLDRDQDRRKLAQFCAALREHELGRVTCPTDWLTAGSAQDTTRPRGFISADHQHALVRVILDNPSSIDVLRQVIDETIDGLSHLHAKEPRLEAGVASLVLVDRQIRRGVTWMILLLAATAAMSFIWPWRLVSLSFAGGLGGAALVAWPIGAVALALLLVAFFVVGATFASALRTYQSA